MSQRIVPFYLDFISPYSYLAWALLRRREHRLGLELDPQPILFAGLLNAHGTLGPAEVEAKRRYVFIDSLRKARLLDIPLAPPFGHPFNPLLALRLASAAGAANRSALVDTLYAATWEDGLEVSNEKALRPYLEQRHQPALIAELFDEARSPEVKQSLRRRTEEAVEAGVFGVPSLMIGDELFWGVDSLEALEATLESGALIDHEQRTAWQSVRPLAQRPR